MPLEDWTGRLAAAIAATLREFTLQIGNTSISLLAVDCHPWHGRIGLSALTSAELGRDALLNDPSEMAAWQHHDFSNPFPAWQPVRRLGEEMQGAYENSSNRPAVAENYFQACARAVTSSEVRSAIELLPRAGAFRVSVSHPDSGREFVA